jgi:D-glycero-D-manno-heptose 1,7-bisphosphate phosphatase
MIASTAVEPRRAGKRAAVFLDRDGVLNRAYVRNGKPHPPASLSELEILPGVPAALSLLRSHGYPLIVVTNQPDVARGTVAREVVEEINERLRAECELDAILTCFHDGAAGCSCRKPEPGLLLQAASELDIELTRSFMVGDRWRDIEAGQRAGCRTFYVDYGYAEARPARYDFRVSSLAEVANVLSGWHK